MQVGKQLEGVDIKCRKLNLEKSNNIYLFYM